MDNTQVDALAALVERAERALILGWPPATSRRWKRSPRRVDLDELERDLKREQRLAAFAATITRGRG